MRTYTFHATGMRCKACTMLIESELRDVDGVASVKASLRDARVEVTADFGEKDDVRIVNELNESLKAGGYALSTERVMTAPKWSEFLLAAPAAFVLIGVFFGLQRIGFVNLVFSPDVGFGSALLIGIVASVSSCMAMVGGLVLSLSANFAKEGETFRPQALFHVGRLVSFFFLGGAVGALGSVFRIRGTGTAILGFVVAVVLIILGINLLDVFPWAKKLQPAIPGFIGKRMHGVKELNHTLTPLLVGIVTFFLPCGFTQSMQLYALSTGSFGTGAVTMLAFALGTFPVLALLSFSSLGIGKMAHSGVFFKAAGLLVIFFGLFNLLNGLASLGIIAPVFNF
ncbi:MAG TPA: sulfite exporter TauE/SafE family protein [Candidatus Fimivivens sp.]|nr:sulfite exporter TauE/SafE family protein [Candidatus Fimivivens sp.]